MFLLLSHRDHQEIHLLHLGNYRVYLQDQPGNLQVLEAHHQEIHHLKDHQLVTHHLSVRKEILLGVRQMVQMESLSKVQQLDNLPQFRHQKVQSRRAFQ
jgi:hypothetical protein